MKLKDNLNMRLKQVLNSKEKISVYLSVVSVAVISLAIIFTCNAMFMFSEQQIDRKDNRSVSTVLNAMKISYNQQTSGLENDVKVIIGDDNIKSTIKDINEYKGDLSYDIDYIDNKSIKNLQHKLKDLVENNVGVDSAYVVTSDKKVQRYSLDNNSSYKYTNQESYTQALNVDQLTWSEPYKREDKTYMTLTSPIVKNNKKIGAVVVDVDLDVMFGQYKEFRTNEKEFYSILVKDEIGYKFIYTSNEEVDKTTRDKYLGESVKAADESSYVKSKKLEDELNNATDNITETNNSKKVTLNKEKYRVHVEKDEESGLYRMVVNPTSVRAKTANNIKMNVALLSIFPSVVGVFLIRKSAIKIGNEVTEVNEAVKKLSEGDLTARIESDLVNVELETGQLARDFNKTCENLSRLVKNISEVGKELNSSASDVSSASQETNSRIEEISATMEAIATGVCEQVAFADTGNDTMMALAEKLDNLNETSGYIYKQTKQIDKENKLGMQSIEHLKHYTEENNASSSEVAKNINELNLKTDSIGVIVETMTNIAEQTNLLALNASIEAARVNDPGFLVLAGEIKKLSDQSAKQAEVIRDIIKDIQKNVNLSVVGMEKSVNINKEQTKAVQSVVAAFEKISKSTGKMNESIDEINQFINTLNKDKDTILKSVEKITQVSNRSAISTEEISASIEEQSALTQDLTNTADNLGSLSEELMQNVEKFKI